VPEDCGASAKAEVGRRATAGSDWSNVRRFMDGIVAEVCGMGRGGLDLAGIFVGVMRRGVASRAGRGVNPNGWRTYRRARDDYGSAEVA
jgi:hypothetical protein